LLVYRDDDRDGTEIDFETAGTAWLGVVLNHFESCSRIGIIAPTSVEGIAFWKAVLLAGKTPIMLQYPTNKLARTYWRREISSAVEVLGIDAIGYWGPLADPDLALPKLDLQQPRTAAFASPVRGFLDGHLTQLSSGTTGFRKGVSVTMADVLTHVQDYNQVLRLGPEDCVVSWLPLYHDMGFIATFLMPLLLRSRLVLVDPVTWVRRPELLFELIERHRGTICFMPNFGFEVTARRVKGQAFDLSSMRQWISCSEPTRLKTMQRFADVARAEETRIANCYAMAENVFAVTQSEGISSVKLGNTEVVSCGKPIPGVALKIIDGEVWVHSNYSLTTYEGGQSVADADGYFPTGDIGELIDGQLYLIGRKRDVMIHAGRKIILSDVDHDVGGVVPQSAGRITTVPTYNPILGTGDPVCLIEDPRYWRKNRDAELLASIRSETGLDQGRVEFVAPGFITKTSSGKVNRGLTATHWSAKSTAQPRRFTLRAFDRLKAVVLDLFPGITPDKPFDEQLDSLGLVNLSLLLSEYGLEPSPSKSLNELRLAEDRSSEEPTGPVIRVVSLFDGNLLGISTVQVLKKLSEEMGLTIQYDHVCCPPAPILLEDLIFDAQFRARDDRIEPYDGLRAALAAIRSADLIIVDDLVQMGWPAINDGHYPKISHRFEAAPRSDLLGVRWARYSERNHLIATELTPSDEITPAVANRAIDDLEDYLGVPILRVALARQFAQQTKDWHIHHSADCVELLTSGYDPANPHIDVPALLRSLASGLRDIFGRVQPREGRLVSWFRIIDQPHWCSWLVNPELVDFVLDRYDSFLVLGKQGSIPYLSSRANRRGKSLTYRSDLICPPELDYECVLQTGSWGEPDIDRPLYPLMGAGWGERPANVPKEIADSAPPSTERPITGTRLAGLSRGD
jgi:acyl-CoA synthetase (AMP-forming)/AMP-acid ligase II